LGPNATSTSPDPVEVPGLGAITEVAAGETTSLALLADGTVRAWGHRILMGGGSTATQGSSTPVQVSGLTDVVDLAIGQTHGLALKSDGSVWSWGHERCGQLGHGAEAGAANALTIGVTKPTATPVAGLPAGIKAITAGRAFSLALDGDGRLWAWGDNRSGQLGNGVPSHPVGPSVFTCYSRGDTGTGQPFPTQVALAEEVISVVAGGDHALALTKSGQVWSWGSNCEGQLGSPVPGVPDLIQGRGVPAPVGGLPVGHVVSLAAGGENFGGHSLALTDDGRVFAWGLADLVGAGEVSGVSSACLEVPQLTLGGLPTSAPVSRGPGVSTPVEVQRPDGSLLGDVVALAAGTAHSLAVTADGKLFGWGRNDVNQLNLQGSAVRKSAVAIPLPGTSRPAVALVAASRHNLAVMGDQAPVRPRPVFTPLPAPGDLPSDPGQLVPGDLPSDPGQLVPNEAIEDARQSLEQIRKDAEGELTARTPSFQPGEDNYVGDNVPKAPGTERIAVPKPVLPSAGTGGGVFLMTWSAMEGETMGDPCEVIPPQTRCNTTGARFVLKKAISYVTPGKVAPRLLFVGAAFMPRVGDLRGVGFQRHCPGRGNPSVAPGCFDVTWSAPETAYWLDHGCDGGQTPCRSDWEPDKDITQVDFHDYDAIVLGDLAPLAQANAGPASREIMAVQRRQQLVDYVNEGNGLVLFGQRHLWENESTPAGMECRPYDPDTCRGGAYNYLPFLDDPEYSSEEQVVSLVSPQDFLSVTDKGKQLELSNEDVNEYRIRPLTWFRESCGFDVFLTDKFQRISAMGTHKKIPDETKCSGVSADPASVLEGNAGTRALTFQVKLNSVRSPDAVGSIQETTQKVHFRTVDGSASAADHDYIPTKGTLEFNTQPGSAEGGPQAVTVQVVGDTAVETDETINLHLTGEGASAFEQTIVGTIVNDDGLPNDGQAGRQESGPPPGNQGGQNNPLAHPGGPATTAVPGSVPAPASAQAQAQTVAQVQAPGAQAQAQSQSQAQGQSQVQAQSHANAPQVAVMKEKQKQDELQRAYTNNQLVPAELLATSRRPNPVLPLALMAGSVISALGLALFRRGLSPASQEEKVPKGDEEQSERPLWLRRKRSQR